MFSQTRYIGTNKKRYIISLAALQSEKGASTRSKILNSSRGTRLGTSLGI